MRNFSAKTQVREQKGTPHTGEIYANLTQGLSPEYVKNSQNAEIRI